MYNTMHSSLCHYLRLGCDHCERNRSADRSGNEYNGRRWDVGSLLVISMTVAITGII